jgi:Arc/MetJ-type ribon-helix-helix transcriptional regulator
MPPMPPESTPPEGRGKTEKSTIRLSAEDHANIAKIVQSGAASNISEAIRVALASYADRAAIAQRLEAIERRLSRLEGPKGTRRDRR